jgi:predicted O-methyltransferase YrrM
LWQGVCSISCLLATSTNSIGNQVSIAAPSIAPQFWFPDITGWFQESEALHLYTAVQLLRPSRILEIGTFYGRSTATICSAIAAAKRPVQFISCDLDFRSEPEFCALFGAIHRVADVHLPPECQEAFAQGLSTLEYARVQLDHRNLLPFVQLRAGDFRSIQGRFDMIFADALHDEREIEINLPAILELLDCEGVLAVHDLTDENRHAIQRVSTNLRFISQSAYLGLFRYESKQ